METKLNLKDYKMTNLSGVGVYVGTYRKYNEGSIFDMWIDLERLMMPMSFGRCAKYCTRTKATPSL